MYRNSLIVIPAQAGIHVSVANDFGVKHKAEDAKADSRVLFCVLSGEIPAS
jgi:hypothetical protein